MRSGFIYITISSLQFSKLKWLENKASHLLNEFLMLFPFVLILWHGLTVNIFTVNLNSSQYMYLFHKEYKNHYSKLFQFQPVHWKNDIVEMLYTTTVQKFGVFNFKMLIHLTAKPKDLTEPKT